MISNSVFENQISRLLWRIINLQKQIIIYLTRGEPDSHVRKMQLDILMIETEIRKIQGEESPAPNLHHHEGKN